jgi:dTDP-4-dehydrorhamnose reductase
MSDILITGSTGQLGTECVNVLKEDHNVVSVSRKELDITSFNDVQDIIKSVKPQYIINCAAYADVENALKEEDIASDINCNGVKNIAVHAQEQGSHVIHISTDYVFSGKKRLGESYIETDGTRPINEYGKTKLRGERILLSHCINSTILRTSWLYGMYGHNFLKSILTNVLRYNRKNLKVIDDQYGCPTWTFSLANQINFLLDHPVQGIVHASSHESCTWFVLAKEFLDLMGIEHDIKPCTSDEFLTIAKRPKNAVISNSTLKLLDYDIMPIWRTALEDFVSKHGVQLIQECKK